MILIDIEYSLNQRIPRIKGDENIEISMNVINAIVNQRIPRIKGDENWQFFKNSATNILAIREYPV